LPIDTRRTSATGEIGGERYQKAGGDDRHRLRLHRASGVTSPFQPP
jgi:hypothetical protein